MAGDLDSGQLTSQGVDLDKLVTGWADTVGARVTLIGADGTVLGESHEDRTRMDNHLNRPEVQLALRQESGSSVRFSRTLGQEMMYTAVMMNGTTGTGFVRLAMPLSEVEAEVTGLQRTILVATLIAVVLLGLLAVLVAGRTTEPIRQLTQDVRKMTAGDQTGPPVLSAPDEVGQLTGAFNAMAANLRSQYESLSTERSKLSAVLERMNDGVVIVDDDGQVQLLNPAAEAIFEIEQQAARNHSLVEVVRHHKLVELWRRSKETGQEQLTPLQLGPTKRSLQAMAIPLGPALPGSTMLLFQDVTRLRQLETVRRDFVSNISHELRTPLASLKALTETLQEGALDDLPAARQFLTRMETEVDALTNMVNELLELTRIESGQVPLKLRPVAPCDIIGSAVERLRLQAERVGLSLRVECPVDLPEVLADPPRIEQVVVNLLHNAIKFTQAGGEIVLSAVEAADGVRFSVEDTGVGILAEELPRIFERFYKTDRARAGGGTGLGLAIARHVVEGHGGRIWAESVAGIGSTFFFTLPTI
jgi:two-component system phosphate regulon sensor histidine kinase PhoR